MSTPTISVVLPTYQRRDLVVGAVESVLAQTFRDFELIVVDDGSTDGTAEALRGIDPRLVFVRQDHAGVSPARNNALRLARGEIVAFVDSDNRWLPEHLAVGKRMLDLHPEALLACTCPGYAVAGHDPPERSRLVNPFPDILFRSPIGQISCTSIRRAALDEVGGFDDALRGGEDADLWLRLALRGPCTLLRRRTTVIRRTRGGLLDRSIRSGDQFEAAERTLDKALMELEGDVGRATVVRGCRDYLRGLRAAAAFDEPGARAAFAEAVTRAPRLSVEPGLALYRLRILPEAAELASRLRIHETVAAAWPDPAAAYVVTARIQALKIALRLGNGRKAVELARAVGLRGARITGSESFSRLSPHIRRLVYRAVHTGRESSDLDSALHVGDHDRAGGDHG